jgi:hypothetical protein
MRRATKLFSKDQPDYLQHPPGAYPMVVSAPLNCGNTMAGTSLSGIEKMRSRRRRPWAARVRKAKQTARSSRDPAAHPRRRFVPSQMANWPSTLCGQAAAHRRYSVGRPRDLNIELLKDQQMRGAIRFSQVRVPLSPIERAKDSGPYPIFWAHACARSLDI